MEKVERTVTLDADAAELLVELAGSSRKQGAYLSDLIRAAAAARTATIQTEDADLATLRTQVQALANEVARLRAFVDRSTQ